MSTALQGILAVDDESTCRCSEAVTRAQAVVVALSSAEAAASAAINLPLARQLQSQKGEVSFLLKIVTDLMAPPKRSFVLQSVGKLLLLGKSTGIQFHGHHQEHQNIMNRSVHDPSQRGRVPMLPSYHSQGYPQQDLSKDSIACLLIRSRSTALIRAMLLAAQPDLALPPASGEHHGLMNQLLRAAFTRMREDQQSWMQAVVQSGFDASALMTAGVPVLWLNGLFQGSKQYASL